MRGTLVGLLVVVAITLLGVSCSLGMQLIPQSGAGGPVPLFRRCPVCKHGMTCESDWSNWSCPKCGKTHDISDGIDPKFSPDG